MGGLELGIWVGVVDRPLALRALRYARVVGSAGRGLHAASLDLGLGTWERLRIPPDLL